MAEIETIVSIISVILVGVTAVFLFMHLYKIRAEHNERLQTVVDQINDAQYYEFKYDKKQNENIKNIDDNVLSVYKSHEKLQNNVKFLEKNSVKKEDLKKQVDTQQANIDQLNASKVQIANGTNKNNIVIEAGRTSDGLNEGLSSINFNGYTQDGDKLINSKKSHWKIETDQRNDQDSMKIDNISTEGTLKNYLWLSDGSVGLNNNKLRISDKWTGWPDTNPEKAEISNDVSGFKQLMIVGNRSAGDVRKVGVWDKLEVHGDQETSGNIKGRSQVCINDSCLNEGDINKAKSLDPKFNSVGRDGTDWFRIFGTANGTAVYNGMSINDGGGLAVGRWGKPAQGEIYASSTIEGNIVKGRTAVCAGGACINQDDINRAKSLDPRVNSIGRDGTDWFRIFGTTNGTAVYNGMSINDGGGLAVGRWGKPAQGEIYASSTIYSSGTIEGDVARGRSAICAGTACMNQDDINRAKSGGGGGGITPDGNGVVTLPPNFKTFAVQQGNPGPMIEKMYGTNLGDRYGIGQFGGGTMRMYTASAFGPATANLSLAKGDGTFDDIVTVKTDRSTTIAGDMSVNGRLWTASGALSGSDVRLKKNIANLPEEEVKKLNDLDPKQYVYKDDPRAKTQFGLIAQDVERVYPNLVETGPNGMKSVRYQDLIPVLIAKVNKLENEIRQQT